MAHSLKFPLALCCALAFATAARAQDAGAGLLGNPGGVRTSLADHGITINIQDAENLMGNFAGGIKTGGTMQGRVTGTLSLDTQKAFGWPGGTLYFSTLQTHGQSLSPYYLDNLQQANSDEGPNQTVLFEAWFDRLFASTNMDLKIGQISIDGDFIVNPSTGLFLNTMASWPAVISYDTYDGGPVTPFAAPGVRLQYQEDGRSYLAGVFNDNPTGSSSADMMQDHDQSGVRFNLNTGALFLAEFQQAVTMPGGLAGVYKLGFWYDTAKFPDQRLGTDRLSLADPASNGSPLQRRGNESVYAVMDQTVWQAGAARHVNVFATVMGSPGPQSLLSFSGTGGVTLIDPLPGRDNDSAGVDFGVTRVSDAAQAFARDTARFSGLPVPARSFEYLVEVTYLAQMTPWLSLQPDLQYVVNPGGGVPDPADPAQRLRNELVVSARATVVF
jgi:porin